MPYNDISLSPIMSNTPCFSDIDCVKANTQYTRTHATPGGTYTSV
jgi:hypothetical protein